MQISIQAGGHLNLPTNKNATVLPEGIALYDCIKTGGIELSNVPVASLFLLASMLAVSGKLNLKNEVLSEWVSRHPAASMEDLQRVQINKSDWKRRQGQTDEALSELEKMKISENAVVRAEYLQAYNQCLLQKSKLTSSSNEKIDLLQRAISNQEALCSIALSAGEISADKKIYYLVGVCEIRGHLMRQLGLKSDLQIEKAHETCRAIQTHESFSPEYQKRLAWELPFNEGIYKVDCERFPEAASSFKESWEALRQIDDVRSRAAVALFYLFAVLHDNSLSVDSDFSEINNFYQKQGRQALLAGDKKLLQARMDFVEARLSA